LDWVYDLNLSRQRRKQLQNYFQNGHLSSQIVYFYEAAQSWIVVLLVGVAIGSCAAFIDVSAGWLVDLKLGYCQSHWYFNRKFCCWKNEDNDGNCSDWQQWGYHGAEITSLGVLVNWLFYLCISTTLAFLATYLVKSLAPTASGSGIPQIKSILGGFILPNFLGKSTLLIKLISLILAVSSGLSLGKEGPSVHLACCIGDMISKCFAKFKNNHAKNREILSASSAAGVAVAFGSPIGGVLYSLEELSTHFPMKTLWRSFFSALVATVILHAFNPFRSGKIVLFQVANDKAWNGFEILFFSFIGLFGGIYGTLVIKLNSFVMKFRKKYLKNYKISEVVVLSFLTTCICYPNIFLRIDMSESMSILFKECQELRFPALCSANSDISIILTLLAACLIRTLLVAITYGCEVPTGIFIPSMAIGACFGRAVGVFVKYLSITFPNWWLFSSCTSGSSKCINPGTYAFLGAAAALCGVTKMTVTVVVIMFELTGASEFILPTMITVFVTKAVGDAFNHGGIADHAIQLNHFPFLEEEDAHLGNIPVAQVMCKNLKAIPKNGWKLYQLENLIKNEEFTYYPIVYGIRDYRIEGLIARNDILKVLDQNKQLNQYNPNAHCFFSPSITQSIDFEEPNIPSIANSTSLDFGPLVDPNPFLVHPKLSLEIIRTFFRKVGPHLLLVELNGNLVGLVTKKDVLNFKLMLESNSS
ncbi:hypothetical protein K502DRAFT_288377, partial [Neoconidiobolus thromboides FSU 785]